jgi:dolichol-phosphate mannosyltransferase
LAGESKQRTVASAPVEQATSIRSTSDGPAEHSVSSVGFATTPTLAHTPSEPAVWHTAPESRLAGPELTIVVPTLNERDNIEPLLERLEAALDGISWEVIFVDDDSGDGTADLVRRIARNDRRIRALQRIGRRGLSAACIEGALASSAPFIGVMDADLQHDPALLPQIVETLKTTPLLDIVIASRYVEGGGIGAWNKSRAVISDVAIRLSRLVVKADIADPMSGFFVLRREVFEGAVRNLSGQGFKILLDLFASSPRSLRFAELPYTFRERQRGESKLDTMIVWEYAMLIGDKLVGRFVPVRFLLFALIGGLGIFVHLGALVLALKTLNLGFAAAQVVATTTAMTFNFLLNNVFTYCDQRLKGAGLVRGLISFYLICAVGAVANVGVAQFLYNNDRSWWMAGLAGALVGSVWNYAATSAFTWKRSGARRRIGRPLR